MWKLSKPVYVSPPKEYLEKKKKKESKFKSGIVSAPKITPTKIQRIPISGKTKLKPISSIPFEKLTKPKQSETKPSKFKSEYKPSVVTAPKYLPSKIERIPIRGKVKPKPISSIPFEQLKKTPSSETSAKNQYKIKKPVKLQPKLRSPITTPKPVITPPTSYRIKPQQVKKENVTEAPTVKVPIETPTVKVPTETPTVRLPTETPTVKVPTEAPTINVSPINTPVKIMPEEIPLKPLEVNVSQPFPEIIRTGIMRDFFEEKEIERTQEVIPVPQYFVSNREVVTNQEVVPVPSVYSTTVEQEVVPVPSVYSTTVEQEVVPVPQFFKTKEVIPQIVEVDRPVPFPQPVEIPIPTFYPVQRPVIKQEVKTSQKYKPVVNTQNTFAIDNKAIPIIEDGGSLVRDEGEEEIVIAPRSVLKIKSTPSLPRYVSNVSIIPSLSETPKNVQEIIIGTPQYSYLRNLSKFIIR